MEVLRASCVTFTVLDTTVAVVAHIEVVSCPLLDVDSRASAVVTFTGCLVVVDESDDIPAFVVSGLRVVVVVVARVAEVVVAVLVVAILCWLVFVDVTGNSDVVVVITAGFCVRVVDKRTVVVVVVVGTVDFVVVVDVLEISTVAPVQNCIYVPSE